MATSFTFRADADLSTVIRTVAVSRREPVLVLIRKAVRSNVVDERSTAASNDHRERVYRLGTRGFGMVLLDRVYECPLHGKSGANPPPPSGKPL